MVRRFLMASAGALLLALALAAAGAAPARAQGGDGTHARRAILAFWPLPEADARAEAADALSLIHI